VNSDYRGDITRCMTDVFQQRLGEDAEITYTSGLAGNHRQLAAQGHPAEYGGTQTADDLADVQPVLPEITFKSLIKLGMTIGYDTFRARENDESTRCTAR